MCLLAAAATLTLNQLTTVVAQQHSFSITETEHFNINRLCSSKTRRTETFPTTCMAETRLRKIIEITSNLKKGEQKNLNPLAVSHTANVSRSSSSSSTFSSHVSVASAMTPPPSPLTSPAPRGLPSHPEAVT